MFFNSSLHYLNDEYRYKSVYSKENCYKFFIRNYYKNNVYYIYYNVHRDIGSKSRKDMKRMYTLRYRSVT
jgi:hypothetical protein